MNLNRDELEVIRAIQLHGFVGAVMATKYGWLNEWGAINPNGPLRSLIDKGIVAPRALTSQPVGVSFELRENARNKAVHAQIKREADRLKMIERAPGGFQIITRG